GALAFGDIAGPDDIVGALEAGVDAIGTTLSGYTTSAPPPPGPDLDLVRTLVARTTVPVYAEGRYRTAEQIAVARDLGASFVVVGGAITDPVALTRTLGAPFTGRGGSTCARRPRPISPRRGKASTGSNTTSRRSRRLRTSWPD